jgi:hypothetical protein
MSEYRVELEITGYEAEKLDEIKAAANEIWDFSEWGALNSDGQVGVYGVGDEWLSRNEEQLAEELARAIWRANDADCEVVVRMVCLEDASRYEFGAADYAKAHSCKATGGPEKQ